MTATRKAETSHLAPHRPASSGATTASSFTSSRRPSSSRGSSSTSQQRNAPSVPVATTKAPSSSTAAQSKPTAAATAPSLVTARQSTNSTADSATPATALKSPPSSGSVALDRPQQAPTAVMSEESRRAAMLLRNVSASDFPTSFEQFQQQFLMDQYQRAKRAEAAAGGGGGGSALTSEMMMKQESTISNKRTTEGGDDAAGGEARPLTKGGERTNKKSALAAAPTPTPPKRVSESSKKIDAERIENLPAVIAPIAVQLPPSPTPSHGSDDGGAAAAVVRGLTSSVHPHQGSLPSASLLHPSRSDGSVSLTPVPSRGPTPSPSATPIPGGGAYDGYASPEPSEPNSIGGRPSIAMLIQRALPTPPPLTTLKYPAQGMQQVALTHLYKKACRQVSNRWQQFTRHSAALRIQRWIRAIWFLQYCIVIRFQDRWTTRRIRLHGKQFVRKGTRLAAMIQLRRKRNLENRANRLAGTLVIQRNWRLYAARRTMGSLQTIRDATAAATRRTLQEWYAARVIQSAVRRWLCQRQTRLARASRKHCRMWRVDQWTHRLLYKWRRRHLRGAQERVEEDAACLIQRTWRQYWQVKQNATLRDWERLKSAERSKESLGQLGRAKERLRR